MATIRHQISALSPTRLFLLLLILALISQRTHASNSTSLEATRSAEAKSAKTKVIMVKGKPVYMTKFKAVGIIDKVCVNLNEFCNLRANGDAAFLSCFAAREAIARVRASYAFKGVIFIKKTELGSINDINLNTKSYAGVLAFSFTKVAANTTADATVEVDAETEVGGDLVRSAALANGGANASATSSAFATSMNAAGSMASTSATVEVKGEKINRFQASIVATAGGFTLSRSEAKAFSQAGSTAYSIALAGAQAERKVDNSTISSSELEQDFTRASALSTSFGEALSQAVGLVSVSFGFEATITNEGRLLDINFAGSRFVGVSCHHPESDGSSSTSASTG